MTTMSERIKALEAKGGDLEEIWVRGGLDDLSEEAAATPTPPLEWKAGPDDVDAKGRTTTAFKDRVRSEARAAGARMVLWFSPGRAPIPDA